MQKTNVSKIHPLLHYDLCLFNFIFTDSYQITRLKSHTKFREQLPGKLQSNFFRNSKMATKIDIRLSCQPKRDVVNQSMISVSDIVVRRRYRRNLNLKLNLGLPGSLRSDLKHIDIYHTRNVHSVT